MNIPAEVVASRTIAQGMTALIAFNPDEEIEENVENMSNEMDSVKSGQVTIAVRDTTIEGIKIKKDDYMGIIDGKIELTNVDRVTVAIQMVEKMLDGDSEIVTIIVGQEGTLDQAESIKSAILDIDEDLEIEIHQGDQPVYPYLISVE